MARLLIDVDGRDRSAEIPHEAIEGDCLTRNPKLARSVIKSQVRRLTEMLGQAEVLARGRVERLQQEAMARMERVLGDELERLVALAKVNPTVRQEEIGWLAERLGRLRDYLGKTHLRLDALRVIVVV